MNPQELALNQFFSTFNARVLQETSVSNSNKKHFFVAVSIADFLENNPIVYKYVKAHQLKHPLLDLDEVSLVYIREDKDYEYLWIGSMMKDDPLFVKRLNYLKNNLINHLSVMWVGEPYDMNSNIMNQADVRLEQIKGIAKELKTELKDKIKENAPIFKNKIKSIKSLLKK